MLILITNAVPLNGGDEALLEATVESLRARWPSCKIAVLCSNVEQVRVRLPDLHFEPDLEFVSNPSERARVSELYRAATVVLSAPGGFLHDFYDISQRLRGFEVAIALGKPVILFAQSIGPFWKAESLRRIPEVLNRVSAICVRDAASKQHLQNCGVDPLRIRETADAAFLWHRLEPALFRPKPGPVTRIALSFRIWPPGDDVQVKTTIEKAERLCHHLLTKPARCLVFLSTCQGIEGYVDDSLLANRIVARLPLDLRSRCQVNASRYGPRELIKVYSECDAFIGMRLHGCILSMLGGTPAMGLGYEQKTEEVFQQLGLEQYQIRFDADAETWLGCAERFLTDMETIRTRLPAALDRLAARANLNLDCIEEVLEAKEHKKETANSRVQPEWTDLATRYEVSHRHLRQVAELVRRLQPSQIVDLGCGEGELRKLCPDTQYVGCDFVIPRDPVPFPFYQCDFNRHELAADLQELELIVCSGLLEYIKDLPAFLRHLLSRLRSGGHLIATYFNMNHISRIWGLLRGRSFSVRADWHGLYSPRDIGRLLAEAGFEVAETFAMNHTFGTAPGIEQTLNAPPVLHRAQLWSGLLAHQFLFVAAARPRPPLSVDEITALVPNGASFVLVDDAQWAPSAFPGRRAIPFLEKDGQYWGPPPDNETAIRELDRLRRAGATFVVFAGPAFWWLDYYVGFTRHLRDRFACLVENENLVVFDLRGRRV